MHHSSSGVEGINLQEEDGSRDVVDCGLIRHNLKKSNRKQVDMWSKAMNGKLPQVVVCWSQFVNLDKYRNPKDEAGLALKRDNRQCSIINSCDVLFVLWINILHPLFCPDPDRGLAEITVLPLPFGLSECPEGWTERKYGNRALPVDIQRITQQLN